MSDRRKGDVLNNTLQTFTSATFLLLACLLIYDRWDNNNNNANIEVLRKEVQDLANKNLYYLEKRQDAISGRQDDYQVNVNRRITLLEHKLENVINGIKQK